MGFAMLLAGTGIFVLGIFGTAITTLKNRLDQKAISTGIKVNNPRVLFRSVWLVGVGVVLAIIGCTVGNCYAKETIMNYAGFGMQLAGIALLVLGAFETARISANIYMNYELARAYYQS
jgi:hypothetical protein